MLQKRTEKPKQKMTQSHNVFSVCGHAPSIFSSKWPIHGHSLKDPIYQMVKTVRTCFWCGAAASFSCVGKRSTFIWVSDGLNKSAVGEQNTGTIAWITSFNFSIIIMSWSYRASMFTEMGVRRIKSQMSMCVLLVWSSKHWKDFLHGEGK